jgi:hypothetical protein
MFGAGPKKAALSDSWPKAPAKHSKYNPVAERRSEFLNQVENQTSLVSKRSMD